MYKIEIAKESRRKKEMKKKFVVALVAAMSLTVAGTGTVFAMNNFHIHGENCEWVVDKEAWHETVHHEEEGHYENGKLLEEEKGHYEEVVVTPGWTENKYVVDKPAWTEEVVHPAETKQEWVVDKEAWTENILKYKCVCNGCHAEFASDEEWAAHDKAAAMNGDFSHGSYTNVPYYETVEHPEEGHWVCNGEPQEPEQKPENPDQKPEQPENPDQKPEQPENPDQKPEQPENPDQKPEQPENPDVETPDAENPETPEQKPEANKENVQTQETETKKEGTTPKTGDTASALPVAGAGLASLGVALATILKKRK